MNSDVLSRVEESQKDQDQLFDAILAKNIIARMVRDRQVNFAHLESCLQDIEKELGTMNQPSIKDIINSNHKL